ncbi:hypothetical protein DFH94DRAFT_235806 [Russula ochroleuca]|uniref:Uncharacterized protein n=1 Tax=Russula ochroleuca TaxID=152965 RepID=A0A9P5N1U0_9AGAM|nr:hypothetical protein DFH94DRAFT_235806 [Russula ochroleuca]
MASISIPPPAGPTSTRLDWGHTGERSSAGPRGSNRGRSNASRSDRGRGGRGRRGGTSTRGARGRNSPPTEKSVNTPTANPVPTKSAPPIVSVPSLASQTSTTSKNSSSSPLPQPLPSVDTRERPKDGPGSAPQHAVDKLPVLTIEPASPTAASAPQSASTTSSKMSTRRRRPQNKQSGAPRSSRNSTTETLASTVNARKSRSGPSSPHPKASPSKNAPPHLSASPAPTVASSAAKSNIDSLVEHVRALAMDHRPTTPNSHIDWADEDDSLPDLDDWGVPSNPVVSAKPDPSTAASIEKAQLELMSPILDDSLKQLPQSFDKTSPSPSVGSGTLSPNIANRALVLLVNGSGDGDGAAEASLPVGADKLEDRSPGLPEPSSQSGPVSPPTNSLPLDSTRPLEQAPVLNTGHSKDTPPHLPAPTSSITPPIDTSQPGRSLADSIHAPPCDAPAPAPAAPEARGTEPAVDTNTKGSTASVTAPAPKSSESEIGASEGPRSAPLPPRNPTHGRSHTVGRPSGGKRSFFSGSSTPMGVAAAKGPHHGRTQSSPVTHRRQHSRPVITMDGMARLARTLGTALPKREVAATNSATSSE